MMIGLGYYSSLWILIPAMIFTIIMQAKVKTAFNRYSQVATDKGMTGAQAARYILDQNGLTDVAIQQIAGSMTDNYNPKTKVVSLSQTVHDVNSIAAVSVACHEVGHAIQYAKGYTPIKIRNAIFPVVNLASALTWPLVIIGLVLLTTNSWNFGNILFNVGVLLFVIVILFHLVTLPTEFNASSRAIEEMQKYDIISSEEVVGAKKVLNAAAMTYVASLAMAVANLIRILAMRRD